MSRDVLLQVRDLQVQRGGRSVLEVPVLDLRAGEVLALMGPNGAGKSTLLLTLAGLWPPTSGSLLHRGIPVRTDNQREAFRRHTTMVFQDPLLFDASVAQNIATGLKLRGMPEAERAPRVFAWAQRLGLADHLSRPARELSGGEAQRTALARAFVLEPEILFLDEPFSALDGPTREALLEDLGHLLADTGTTAVVSTHDRAEAARLAHRLAVMHEGRVLQVGGLREVMNHPEDPLVATFVGMETLLKASVVASGEGMLRLQVRKAPAGTEVLAPGDAAPGQVVLLGVRPDQVALSLQTDRTSSARNAFSGTVTKVIPQGPFFKVELNCGFFLAAYVTAQSLSELDLRPGSPVVASFKATSVHLIRKEGLDSEL